MFWPGLTNALGAFIVASWVLQPRMRRDASIALNDAFLLLGVFFIAFYAGARLWNIAANALLAALYHGAGEASIVAPALALADPRRSGFSAHGGILCALVVSTLVAHRLRATTTVLVAEYTRLAPLALICNRVGTLIASAQEHSVAAASYALWPLLEILGLVALQAALLEVRKRELGIVLFFAGYSVIRLAVEAMSPAVKVGGFTIPQWASLVTIVLTAFVWFRFLRAPRVHDLPEPVVGEVGP